MVCGFGYRCGNGSRTHVVAELALHKYRGVQGCLSSKLDHYKYYALTRLIDKGSNGAEDVCRVNSTTTNTINLPGSESSDQNELPQYLCDSGT